LNRELDRVALGDRYRPPITLEELAERFLAQHPASEQTITYARRRLVRPLRVLGDAQAADVSTEALQRVVTAVPGKSYRRDITRTLRMVYRWGVDAGLVDHNPAAKVKAPKPIRAEKIVPFESWAEVDAVAEECGRWAPLVTFMADTGARPAEAIAVEHRHLSGAAVELPGRKTTLAWRTVHMTGRGCNAVAAVPRALNTRCVFHVDGRPISWVYFRREVWAPALEAAGLEHRPPYNLRHTFALWSLRAGVPIATLAREMGHESTEHTFRVYGGWCLEVGAEAAALRESWAEGVPITQADER
jgi:integrase